MCQADLAKLCQEIAELERYLQDNSGEPHPGVERLLQIRREELAEASTQSAQAVAS